VSLINLEMAQNIREHLHMLHTFGVLRFRCPCSCTLCIDGLNPFFSVGGICVAKYLSFKQRVDSVVDLLPPECIGHCTWYSSIKLQVILSLKSR
jgi:hypothetical protein